MDLNHTFISQDPAVFYNFINRFPYAVIFGMILASFLACGPLLLKAFFNWVYDIGKYGILFPFFWAVAWFIIIFSTATSLYYQDQLSFGLAGFVNMFAVVTAMAICLYLSFFLFICCAEVFNEECRSFLRNWAIIFIVGFGVCALWLVFNGENALKPWEGNVTASPVEEVRNPDMASWMSSIFFPESFFGSKDSGLEEAKANLQKGLSKLK